MRSKAFPGDARIGVMASGGLSHFVVDEAFDRCADRCVLRRRDKAFFRNPLLIEADVGKWSEMRNWICLAGAAWLHADSTR